MAFHAENKSAPTYKHSRLRDGPDFSFRLGCLLCRRLKCFIAEWKCYSRYGAFDAALPLAWRRDDYWLISRQWRRISSFDDSPQNARFTLCVYDDNITKGASDDAGRGDFEYAGDATHRNAAATYKDAAARSAGRCPSASPKHIITISRSA